MLSALFYILVTIHIFVCIFLIVVVLFQSGKEGMGGLLGVPGGSIENVHFHSRLNKVTTYVAVIFLFTTIFIGLISQYRQRVITRGAEPAIEEPMPPVEEEVPEAEPIPETDAVIPFQPEDDALPAPLSE